MRKCECCAEIEKDIFTVGTFRFCISCANLIIEELEERLPKEVDDVLIYFKDIVNATL